MQQLKTECDRCKKQLGPSEWSTDDWPLHCGDDCANRADKEAREVFEKEFSGRHL
ncbi:MAG: hypothetical protein HRU18_00815 [Pseudoalteromonas sp.]|uniref:hypothetical protein n=1 Tax=Pseudoalteromonas sp. TaxID=53249 RepID=UPI001DEEF41B|nr:hypothetical protein [Pseudoalteromonas sp.]NRA76721.1 hypothetical protein [Pseudoalteromonas sp.]